MQVEEWSCFGARKTLAECDQRLNRRLYDCEPLQRGYWSGAQFHGSMLRSKSLIVAEDQHMAAAQSTPTVMQPAMKAMIMCAT